MKNLLSKIIFLLLFTPFIASAVDITLLWNAVNDATSYELRHKSDADQDYVLIDVGDVTQYEIKDLLPDTKYWFSVRVNASNNLKSEWHPDIHNVRPEGVSNFGILNITNNGGTININ